jgi:hypothetical protein
MLAQLSHQCLHDLVVLFRDVTCAAASLIVLITCHVHMARMWYALVTMQCAACQPFDTHLCKLLQSG